MYIKKAIAMVLQWVLLFGLCSCNKEQSVKNVSDIAYTNNKSNHIVYVEENGQYVPFIVLTDDYYGNTLLLRKDVMETPRRINDYSSLYEDCEMDKYLNNEYIEMLGDLSANVKAVDLEIASESALGTAGRDTKTINRKVFLLSCKELDLDKNLCMGDEGIALTYFDNLENRVAYCNGEAYGWWLRTANTYATSCTYVISPSNVITDANAYDLNGVRPAFCVSGDMNIVEKEGIVDNQKVYVFASEK